jgi:toxin ParE1/3/4
MKYRLLTVAEEDLADAAAWYERQEFGLGSEFLNEFEAAMNLVCRHPEAWRRLSRRHRRCLFRRFPFSVLYTVAGDTVIVSGIMDSRMDPQRQRERMRRT